MTNTDTNPNPNTEAEPKAGANEGATSKSPILLSSSESQGQVIAKVKAELEGARRIFDNGEAAFTAAAKISEIEGMNLPILVAGVGNVSTLTELPDWAVGRTAVAAVGVRRDKTNGFRAIAIFPVPTVEDYDADSVGHDWLDKIAVKETSHVAFRALRNVPDSSDSLAALEEASKRMPVTVSDYAEVHRAAGGIDLNAFNTVWTSLRRALIDEYPQLKAALPGKGEIINSVRSKSYAEREYGDLESQGLFVFIGESVINMCAGLKDEKTKEPAPVDASEVQDWLDGRDTLTIAPAERQELTTSLDLTQLKF